MNNYNPRQPTSFRFKDSREIENFKFFTGNYDFEEQELLENVSQNKIYGSIIEAFKEAIRTDIDIGVILYDGPVSQNTYIGFIIGDIGYLYTISTSSIFIVNLEYDNQRDTLRITNTTEDILVDDNVKTFFGNQSIMGTGNIDLYRHLITINCLNSISDTIDIVFEYISSNNLKVDSIQDLTALTKAKNGTSIPVVVTLEGQNYENFVGANGIMYDGSVWQIGLLYSGTLIDNTYPITPIYIDDTVTTI